jgi:hypothetical protein
MDKCVLFELRSLVVPRLAYHRLVGGNRGSQMEWIIESYDRRTDRDGENRFTTEDAFIRASEDYSATLGGLSTDRNRS